MGSGRAIFLVGFMGSGKTEVGGRIAVRLGVPFVDLDERIAATAGKSVPAIFAEHGEARFRALESRALRDLEPILPQGVVVATGGGACVDPGNRAWMRAHGATVWLDASLAALEARVARDGSRPLYGDGPALSLLFVARRAAYTEAEHRVDTSDLDAAEAAEAVIAALAQARTDREPAS
jgi:shikimate kinase